MRYLTDGEHLYEYVTERLVRNAGLRGGTIRSVLVVDCVSGDSLEISGPRLRDCHDVTPAPDQLEGMWNARYHA